MLPFLTTVLIPDVCAAPVMAVRKNAAVSTLLMAAGAVLFVVGMAWMFRPDMTARFYRLLKDTVFNDARMALDRRKWAYFYLLTGFLLLFIGLQYLK